MAPVRQSKPVMGAGPSPGTYDLSHEDEVGSSDYRIATTYWKLVKIVPLPTDAIVLNAVERVISNDARCAASV